MLDEIKRREYQEAEDMAAKARAPYVQTSWQKIADGYRRLERPSFDLDLHRQSIPPEALLNRRNL
jgi:hypothetical protein